MIDKTKLKLIFHDILRGYSSLNNKTFRKVYIKHLTSHDATDVDVRQQAYVQEAISKGLPTFKEQEEFIIKSGDWSEEKDKKIFEQKNYLKGLLVTKSKLWRDPEIKRITQDIEKSQGKITQLEVEKRQLIGFTAEEFAANKVNEYYIFHSLYKDTELKKKYFKEQDFKELDNEEMKSIVESFNEINQSFTELNLKAISLSPFFTNLFYLSNDDVTKFYGKSIIFLTFFQAQLFSYGRYFKNVLSDAKSRPPEEVLEDPEKVIEWYNSANNANDIIQKLQNKDSAGVSLVGASKENLKKLGVDTSQKGPDLAKEAAKKGGVLNMQDLLKLHGYK